MWSNCKVVLIIRFSWCESLDGLQFRLLCVSDIMNKSDFDVEFFRKPHESNHEWDLRRAFILAHHDQIPDNRLLCLANCFVSIECYGCRYPEDVMKQMEELGSVAKSKISRHKPLIGQPPGVKFVKSSDGADKKTNPSASLGVRKHLWYCWTFQLL